MEWEMQDSHPSHGILMGMATILLKLIGMGWELEELRWEWERLLLMYSHAIIIFPSKSLFDIVDL